MVQLPFSSDNDALARSQRNGACWTGRLAETALDTRVNFVFDLRDGLDILDMNTIVVR
jgi:hypothetical protein